MNMLFLAVKFYDILKRKADLINTKEYLSAKIAEDFYKIKPYMYCLPKYCNIKEILCK